MKVLPLIGTKVNVITPKMTQHSPARLADIKTTIAKSSNLPSQARANLERYAEEMKPDAYIEMRNYLSRLEMEELVKNDML